MKVLGISLKKNGFSKVFIARGVIFDATLGIVTDSITIRRSVREVSDFAKGSLDELRNVRESVAKYEELVDKFCWWFRTAKTQCGAMAAANTQSTISTFLADAAIRGALSQADADAITAMDLSFEMEGQKPDPDRVVTYPNLENASDFLGLAEQVARDYALYAE